MLSDLIQQDLDELRHADLLERRLAAARPMKSTGWNPSPTSRITERVSWTRAVEVATSQDRLKGVSILITPLSLRLLWRSRSGPGQFSGHMPDHDGAGGA